ncbi:Dynactin subunit 4 [Verticillium dahliae VDG2]|nr:Dynactin subunit 4 [Verticillium dahliae VDG2]
MASKKDMRGADLVIPYQAPKPKETQELSSTLSSTLPMAVMLTRNRFIGWAAVIYSVQNWLGESEDQKKTATTPGYFNVTMSLVSLLVAYLPLFLPPKLAAAATGTAPAAPLPLQ